MDRNGTPGRLRGRLGRCSTLAAGGAATILTLGAAAGPATASAHPEAVTNFNGSLSSVTAVSTTDAWAVGQNGSGDGLILHWDGTTWAKAVIPTATETIQAVSATSADDAWAVGTSDAGTSSSILVLHWDGTSWTNVATPATGQRFSGLSGVSAQSPTDVWAVGETGSVSVSKSLVLHWNGSTWTKTPLPKLPGIGLLAVHALSATDVWAAGAYDTLKAPKRLVLHWDGTKWSTLASTKTGELQAVTALSATDAWAAGAAGKQTLVLHCDGTRCSRVPSPNPGTLGSPGTGFRNLLGVTALSPSDAWAVGTYGGFLSGGKVQVGKTLVLHWDGTNWSQVASPSVGKDSSLSGVAASSASQAWAVGRTGRQVLILNWDGTSWTQS